MTEDEAAKNVLLDKTCDNCKRCGDKAKLNTCKEWELYRIISIYNEIDSGIKNLTACIEEVTEAITDFNTPKYPPLHKQKKWDRRKYF